MPPQGLVVLRLYMRGVDLKVPQRQVVSVRCRGEVDESGLMVSFPPCLRRQRDGGSLSGWWLGSSCASLLQLHPIQELFEVISIDFPGLEFGSQWISHCLPPRNPGSRPRASTGQVGAAVYGKIVLTVAHGAQSEIPEAMGVISSPLAARDAVVKETCKQYVEHLVQNHAAAEPFRGKPRLGGRIKEQRAEIDYVRLVDLIGVCSCRWV